MFDFGDCRDDNIPLDLHNDDNPATTSLLDFYRALHDFLCQNQIEFIGPFRMRLEGTSDNSWRLLIEGNNSASDLNASNQVGLGLASPIMPIYSDNLSAYETAEARTSITFDSSSVYLTIIINIDMLVLTRPRRLSPGGTRITRAVTPRMT